VNLTRLDPTRPPTESGVALRTVHLVTPVNLENHGGTLGAVSRVLGEELSRCDVVGVARMFRVLVWSLDLVTLWTRPVFTHTTLPRRTQESLAVFKGARPNKLALLVFNLSPVKTIHQLHLVPFHVFDINENITHSLALFLCQSVPYDTRLKLRGDSVLNSQGGEFQGGRTAPVFLGSFPAMFKLGNLRI